MTVIVACEFSGTVRRAFRAKGHEAWSCDLLPAEDNSPHHIQADINIVLNYPGRAWLPGLPEIWDLMIAHPPCRYLAVSGARWFKDRQREQADALDFVPLYAHNPATGEPGQVPSRGIEVDKVQLRWDDTRYLLGEEEDAAPRLKQITHERWWMTEEMW